MRTLGNILWYFPFLGFISAFFTFLFGILATLTILASPIGLGLIEYSKFLLAPFSYEMMSIDELDEHIEQNPLWETYSFFVTILYLPIGIILCIITIAQIIGLFCSVVGIPVALVLAKSLSTYLNPVGKKCVDIYVAEEIRRRNAERNTY